jgi:hypothetical protein
MMDITMAAIEETVAVFLVLHFIADLLGVSGLMPLQVGEDGHHDGGDRGDGCGVLGTPLHSRTSLGSVA